MVGGLWLIYLLSGNIFNNFFNRDIIWILLYGGLIGLVGGLIGGYFNGGRACLQHYILRFFLWRAGSIPWNYSRFLDYAAEHILLRKVGGRLHLCPPLVVGVFCFAGYDINARCNQTRGEKATGMAVACNTFLTIFTSHCHHLFHCLHLRR